MNGKPSWGDKEMQTVEQAIKNVQERLAPYQGEDGLDSDRTFGGLTLALGILKEGGVQAKAMLQERAQSFRDYIPTPDDVACGVERASFPEARQVIAALLSEVAESLCPPSLNGEFPQGQKAE